MATRRSEQLKTVAQEFTTTHDEWVNDERRPVPDATYWDAVDRLLEVFGTGDIPEESRELAAAVEEFAEQVSQFDDREEPGKNQYPGNSFWAAREKISACLVSERVQASLPPLETIPALAALRGITHGQIAKIYGFKDRNGNLLTHLVQQELDNPGSVLKTPGSVDGRDWTDPRKKVASDHTALERQSSQLLEKRKRSAKSPSKPCPETPQQLWLQKVSVAQSAKMLGRSETEVAQLFAAFDEEQTEKLLNGDPSDPVLQAIREKAAAGMAAGERQDKLVRRLASEMEVPLQRVTDALRGWKPDAKAEGKKSDAA